MKKRFLVLLFLFLSLTVAMVSAATLTTTDVFGNLKTDFSPEEIVFIKGTGFGTFKLVSVQITRPDGFVESGFVVSNNLGRFTYDYNLDGIVGNYTIYATNGIVSAQTTFTDAAIWSTRDDCGGSNQDVNHYSPGDDVFINGDGFDSGTYDWNIKGKPGGASCDPNAVVASGTVAVNSSGEFCFNAYTILDNDCGEYQIKFDVKGDNYRVEGNVCTNSSQCGTPSSELQCSGNDVVNASTNPLCSDGSCSFTNSTQFVKNCGSATSQLVCFGNNLTNITTSPRCSEGACANTTNATFVQTCQFGCTNGACNPSVCGNGIEEANEECDDGNSNNFDSCRNDCTLPLCGDSIVDLGEECDDGNLDSGDGCNTFCELIICYDNTDCGIDFMSGQFCIANATAKNTTSFICNNPGTSDSFCTNSTQPYIIDQCLYQCSNGECVSPSCGDGTVQVQFGEECEPPNTATCDSQCHIIQCEDEDRDQVCDENDMCPNTPVRQEVDQMGCDIFQFCDKQECGYGCFEADWKNNEEAQFPKDCTLVVVLNNGIEQSPICVPTVEDNMCAG